MKWYGKLYIGILLVVLYLPIFFLMFYSFNSAGNMVHFEHFTLEHYLSLIHISEPTRRTERSRMPSSA